MDHKYTVLEIDQMRNFLARTPLPWGVENSASPLEERLRTAMLAGLRPAQLEADIRRAVKDREDDYKARAAARKAEAEEQHKATREALINELFDEYIAVRQNGQQDTAPKESSPFVRWLRGKLA